MPIDYLIQNGHVLDPAAGRDRTGDIAVAGERIAEGGGQDTRPLHTVDAAGCYVLPGLIDYHTHLFAGGSGFGVSPDLLLATGVTTAVDAGSAGCANFEAFYRSVCIHSRLRIKSFLNLSPIGQAGFGIQEQADPATWDIAAISRLLSRYPGEIAGLKLRIGRPMLGGRGLAPLREAVRVAQELQLPLSVHVTDSPLTAEEIAACLPNGSIYCHVYHGKGNTIIDGDGVFPAVREAAGRGVVFDAANGKSNFDFAVAQKAIAAGFYPDIISTDITPSTLNIGRSAKSLPYLMSKYLSLGMTLPEVVRRVTENPARLLGLPDSIGTLRAGAGADITICRLAEGTYTFEDANGETRTGSQLLVPVATFSKGSVVFCSADIQIA